MSAAAQPPADLRRTWPNIDTSPIHLPNEIIEEILSKSDVKSLVRFKSVSKSWQSVISRILESKLSENQNMFLFWAVPQNESDYGLYLTRLEKDGKFRREPLLGYPSGKPLPYAVCSCNGLVLLNINSYEGVMLWNPFIGKHITIPYFNAQDYPLYCHLYHDSTTNDHRIVFVNEDCYAEYSCKNKSWGKKKYCTHELIDDAISAMVALVDGCLYWLHYDGDEIMCFDFRDGKLHKLEVPNGRNELELLKEVSGRLCLYFCDEDGKLHLWMMEENRSVEKHWRKVMENLHILRQVENFKFSEEAVERIPNIKKLELRYSGREGIEHEDYYCLRNIQRLQKLESLDVSLWIDFRKVESLNKLTFPHSLKKLTLSMIPNYIFNDILEKIGSLPLLEKLKLWEGGFRRGEWEIAEGQFPCLKYLGIFICDGLKKLTAQDESTVIFQSLEHLYLFYLEELEEIPYEIGEIVTLQKVLHIRSSPKQQLM